MRRVCTDCHSEGVLAGELSFEKFDVAKAAETPAIAEKMIAKLQAGMMPPPGAPRPGGDTLIAAGDDARARARRRPRRSSPNPGGRTFQRLNRAEYERVDQGSARPRRRRRRLAAARHEERELRQHRRRADAVGRRCSTRISTRRARSAGSRSAIRRAEPKSVTYKLPRLASQTEHVEGAPMGTRGGVSVMHNFPADGEYVFAVSLHAIPTGQLYGSSAPFDEKVEISVERRARRAARHRSRHVAGRSERAWSSRSNPVPVRAGPHRVTAAFVRTFDGPVNDIIAPVGHSIADTQIGSQGGITIIPHLQDFVVRGPFNPTGVSETPSRQRIFTCRPTSPDEARPCATKIVGDLGARGLSSTARRRTI